MRPIATLIDAMRKGETTARALAEEAIAAIADPAREGGKVYIDHDPQRLRYAADGMDRLRRAGHSAGPLAGLPISVKDLFDLEGEVTRAGSTILADSAPAKADAPAIARLRGAGALVVGRTNMSEFAFSGLGLNPHYGTPGNPADRSRIPGGSSSGAGVSVVEGMAAAAIGTDTGGSIRIPAAFCGIAGFKPSHGIVPSQGMIPLCPSFDTSGPLAPTIACCWLIHQVLTGEVLAPLRPVPLVGLRLATPANFVIDDMDETVAVAYERAIARLSAAGALIEEITIPEYPEIVDANARGGFPAAESFAWHRELLERSADAYDPRVRARIERGRTLAAADYIELQARRQRLITSFNNRLAAYDALIMPTVPVVPPKTAPLENDPVEFTRTNMLVLRNPSTTNFLNGCAANMPMHSAGELPSGLSIAGPHGADRKIAEIAAAVERVLAPTDYTP